MTFLGAKLERLRTDRAVDGFGTFAIIQEGHQGDNMNQETPNNKTELTLEDKQWALLSYLVPPLTGLMILFIKEKAEKPVLMYHALVSIALGALGTVLFCVYPLIWFYCLYLGLSAYQGREITVPYLSDWIKEQGWVKVD
jgi:hypothetical protein